MRPIAHSLILVCATVAAGLALRLVPLGLPGGIVKYGGSLLWALMVYWIVSSLKPKWFPAKSALVSVAAAFAVELSQLYHAPALDAFRSTGLGALLLGRVFSTWDLTAYAAAIIAGAAMDRAIRGLNARD